jgi:ABC-type antimicrobial peptide transport system permease subunit
LANHEITSPIGAATLLAIVSLGAAFIFALRASRIDPMTALRYE